MPRKIKISHHNPNTGFAHALTASEFQKVVYAWNDTSFEQYPANKTLHALFAEQVARSPAHIAVIDETQQLSYQALDEASNQLARFIQTKHPSAIIALSLERSVGMLIGLLAILKSGAAYVPVDPHYPLDRIQYLLEDTQTNLVLTQSDFIERFDGFAGVTSIALDTKPYLHESTHAFQSSATPDDLAYVIYTSGTTGVPKGVAIPHRGVVNRLDWMQRAYPIGSADVVLQKTPFSFDVSVWELFWAHQVGATLVMAKPNGHQDPNYLHALIQRHHISVVHFVPSMLSTFSHTLNTANLALSPSLRFVFCSGEALGVNQVNAFYALSNSDHPVELHNLYGPTEASIDVTAFSCTRDITQVYIGKPIQNMQTYVLDESLKPVGVGVSGELYLGGIGLAREYLNKPELTASRFLPNPFLPESSGARLYKTGDLARWTSDGNIEYLGRNDFQVKIRGHRIELGEIETVLATFPSVRQTIVIMKENITPSGTYPYLVAYYVSEAALDSDLLLNHLKQQLPDFMLPGGLIHLDAFPLTSNGKLDRAALPEHEFHSNRSTPISPNTPLEQQLLEIWTNELGVAHIGMQDHFIALGGHSLIAARIVSTINHRLNKNLTLPAFYEHPTLEALSTHLLTSPTLEAIEGAVQLLHTVNNLPLNDFQLILWLAYLFEPKAKKMNIVARRRIDGTLNPDLLKLAFDEIFKHQDALSYRIANLYPAQSQHSHAAFNLEESSCLDLTTADYEHVLLNSFNGLFAIYPWPKRAPLVIARLFYLPNQVCELQLCMPHLIADEFSMHILCNHLSTAYLQLNNQANINAFSVIKPFKEYVLQEQQNLHKELEQKRSFWENYLDKARLFAFPKDYIIKNMDKQGLNYSTYLEIPQLALNRLKQFCTQHHVGLSDAISAILAKSISEHCHETSADKKIPVLINLIKSTRNNPHFDNTIGCFVRVDPIRIHLSLDDSLPALATQIHKTIVETAPHQHASTLLKFACLTRCFQKKTVLLSWITRIGMPIYTKILRTLKLSYNDHRTLNLCWRLAGFDRKNRFIVNLNLWNNFILDKKNKTDELFGLPTIGTPLNRYELSTMDTILDVCLLRDESSQKNPFLVISTNLKSHIKESIGNRMIELMLNSNSYNTSSPSDEANEVSEATL